MDRLVALAIAATLLTAAALLTRSSGGGHERRPGQAHNPLELWHTANVRVEAAPDANGPANGPRISCNVTAFAGLHAWVEVVWSGVPGGACVHGWRLEWRVRLPGPWLPSPVCHAACGCSANPSAWRPLV